jgi:hypothetical protein
VTFPLSGFITAKLTHFTNFRYDYLFLGFPALLCSSGQLGDFLGGPFVFISVISMLELKIQFEGNTKKGNKKMKLQINLKCKCNSAKSLGIKAADH